MAQILQGAPVAGAITDRMKRDILELSTYDIRPTLALVRVGERHDDIAYERGAMKFCVAIGVGLRTVVLPEDVDARTLYATLADLNSDSNVHGILMFRPLPSQIDESLACQMITPAKDVDGCTNASLVGAFTGTAVGFTPSTAQAVMEVLHYYGISCEGKRAVILGRSLVVGRPLAMLMMQENATVTICHSRTPDVPSLAREADILVSCTGKTGSVGADYFNGHQVVIDVGIGWDSVKGGLSGDVQFDEARRTVAAVTPVPGGVGTVTTSVSIAHVVEAAKQGLE